MTKQHTIYSDAIDGKALSQFHDALSQPWAVKGALMPDAHAGYSLPIGAVVATEGVVVPAWVGFDIGCGMLAVETTFDAEAVRGKAKDIFNAIYRDVPVGLDAAIEANLRELEGMASSGLCPPLNFSWVSRTT